ncbi:BTB/POZ domain-containing protein 6-A-like [Bradysia coprophila]|uniref:BTB/POZ domain-containing protein 6-A-like n=1 Tax=Bradysia coprophila TaxID=38358 RepID=UPI00187D87C0|nr:BTB/POZ domain-containing protein 6-A-like [Bradysia coprophila]
MSLSGLFRDSPFNVQNHYLKAETADVFFICGKNEMNERIPAHKILLAGSTNVFEKMFYGTLCEGDEVVIADATPNGFRQFLHYFYVNDMQFSLEFIDELMYLAKKYLLDSYFAECCEFLMQQTEPKGILIAYEQSIRFELAELKKKMETLIAANGTVLCSEYFTDINRDFLKQIIQIPVVRIEQSKSVFDGCIQWAQANCKRANIDGSVMQNVRDQLGDCFQQIEFSSMTSYHLTECVEKFGDLFTAQELQRVVSIISARCTIPSVGRKSEYEISKQTDIRVEVKEGSQTELQFIPKKRMLLNAFTMSQCSGFGSDGGEEGYFVSVAKILTDDNKKRFLHTEFFPFDHGYALREDIVLEPNSTYSIHIQFLSNASYFGRQISHSADCPIEILPVTNSNFIASLNLKSIAIN